MYLRRLRTLTDKLVDHPATPIAECSYKRRIAELSSLMATDVELDCRKCGTKPNPLTALPHDSEVSKSQETLPMPTMTTSRLSTEMVSQWTSLAGS